MLEHIRVLPVAIVGLVAITGCNAEPTPARDAAVTDGGTERDAFVVPRIDAGPVDANYPDTFGPVDASFGPDETPVLTFTESPVDDLPEGTRFASDVPYGTDDEQVIDVLLPASETPTAAVLYIHGGGFTGGSRTGAYGGAAESVHTIVEAGIAWIGVDYRLLEAAGTENEGVIKSLRDCRRALQFVRRHAETFNVDPDRIGLFGGSAGAGTSLWLAFHPDMADAASADLVARESTRPNVVAVVETQSTYDTLRWAPDVFHEEYAFVSNDTLIGVAALRSLLVQFYGLPGELQGDGDALRAYLERPEYVAYRNDVDMLLLLSSDDVPAYVSNTGDDTSPLAPGFDLLHHPLHAMALVNAADAAGYTLDADVQAYDVSSPDDAMSFLVDHLTE